MRVPGIPQPSESLNALPGVRVQSTYIREDEPLLALQEPVRRVNEIMEQADNLRVEDMINRTRVIQNSVDDEAKTRLGAQVLPKNGKTFTDEHLGKFDEEIGKIESELSSDRQKMQFRKKANILRTSLQMSVGTHEKNQIRAHADSVDNGTINLEAQNAAKNVGNTVELSLGQMRIQGAVDSLAKRNGWSEEEKLIERQKALTGFHGTVIASALDGNNLDYAKSYLEQHGEEITPAVREKMQGALLKKQADLTVDSTAEGIFKALGPQSDKDPVSLDRMYQAIPADLPPEVKKGIKQSLHDMAVTHDYSVKQRENATVSGFYQDIEKGANWKQIKSSPLFAGLDGKAQNSLRSHYELERGITREDKTIPAGAAITYWKMIENPDRLKAMSVDEIFALTPVLGKRYRDDLLERRKQTLNSKSGSVKEGVVNDAIKFYGLQGGYLVKKGNAMNPIPKDQEEWAEINYKINKRIESEGAKTEEAVSSIVRSTMAKVKIESPGRLWGTRIAEERLSSMTDEELDAAVVKVPPADLEIILASFLRRGISGPTKRQILEAHAALTAED